MVKNEDGSTFFTSHFSDGHAKDGFTISATSMNGLEQLRKEYSDLISDSHKEHVFHRLAQRFSGGNSQKKIEQIKKVEKEIAELKVQIKNVMSDFEKQSLQKTLGIKENQLSQYKIEPIECDFTDARNLLGNTRKICQNPQSVIGNKPSKTSSSLGVLIAKDNSSRNGYSCIIPIKGQINNIILDSNGKIVTVIAGVQEKSLERFYRLTFE